MQNKAMGGRRSRGAFCALVMLCCFRLGGWLYGQEGGSGLEVRRMHGVVLDGVTHRPVARALVTSTDQRMGLFSDSEGKFEFEVRVAGGASSGLLRSGDGSGSGVATESLIYLMARKPGYRSTDRPTIVSLADGKALAAEVQIRLTPEAVVTGRVIAQGADALSGVLVQLLQKQIQDGLGVWRPMQTAQSNAHGEYRFVDLAAGDYKIKTAEWMEPGGLIAMPGKQMVGYPPISYPGGTSFAPTALLHVAAGQTVQADLNLRAKPYYPIEIPVANYVSGTNLNVIVESQDGGAAFGLGFNLRTHTVEGALPTGLYLVALSSFGVEAGIASLELAVANRPLRTAPVALVPGGVIPVVVREEFTSAEEVVPAGAVMNGAVATPQQAHQRSVEVYLQSDDLNIGGAGLSNPPGVDSSDEGLVLENVHPGSYHVIVMPRRGYAATVTANGVDLLHHPLVVAAGGGGAAIEITLRDDTGTISGTVSGQTIRSDPYDQATALWCIPVGEEGAGRLAQGFVDTEGKFIVPHVMPGRYIAFAASSSLSQTLEYRNPEAMKWFESKGVLLTVGPGQKVSAVVPVLAMEAN